MKINNLNVKLAGHPTIGEHIVLKLKNTDTTEFFVYDEIGDAVTIRLSLDTALQLAQFLDETYDKVFEETGLKAITKV